MNIAHLAALVSGLHVLGLAIALGSLYARGRAFRRRDLPAAFVADNWWGLSAVITLHLLDLTRGGAPFDLTALYGSLE